MALAVYPVWAIAAVTLFRVLSATFSGFLIARLTVAIETPASLATSSIVAGLIGCFSNFSYAFQQRAAKKQHRDSRLRLRNIAKVYVREKVFST